jgi:hypothetical protein
VSDEPPSSSSSGLGFTPTNTEPSSIDGIINALYGALSFAEGGGPDLARLNDLFAEGARLIKVGKDGAESMALSGFVERIERGIRDGRLTSLRERELARRTDVFGAIAQVFGTFERHAPGRDARGINSIQLRNDGARWWIESLMWADERADMPVPEAYLPRPSRGDEVKKRRRARTLRTEPHGAASSG